MLTKNVDKNSFIFGGHYISKEREYSETRLEQQDLFKRWLVEHKTKNFGIIFADGVIL